MGRLLSVVCAVALLAATDLVHSRIPDDPRVAKGEAYVPVPRLAKFASLGFDSLVADYYWLQAIQLVGGAVENPAEHAHTIGRIIDVVTQLNPHVDHPYRFAAIWMTDSEESVRFANELMERGIAHHPDDWRNYFYKGFNHFYYLYEHGEAADALERAAALPGSPPYLTRLVPRLRAQKQGLGVAAMMLRELRDATKDEVARAEYEKALDEIETERQARFLDQAREAYKRRHGRDIEKVSDLVEGPAPLMEKLPDEIHGWEWKIHEVTGEIVSSYYDARYQVHQFHRPNKFTPAAHARQVVDEEGNKR